MISISGVAGSEGVAFSATIAGLGQWNLRQLGANAIELSPQGQRRKPSVEFDVPPDGGNPREKGDTPAETESYLVRLDAFVKLAPDTGPGSILISADVGGRTGAQVDINVRRHRGHLIAIWNTVSLANGERRGYLKHLNGRVELVNYLPFDSVVPGENQLFFRLEQFGDARVAKAKILPESGLMVSPLRPAYLKLEPKYPNEQPVPGDPFVIGFRIRNTGERPAHDVRVELLSLSRGARIVGRRNYTFAVVDGSAPGKFVVQANMVGTLRLQLDATSENTNHPAVTFKANIMRGRTIGDPDLGWLVGAALAGMCVLGWQGWKRIGAR